MKILIKNLIFISAVILLSAGCGSSNSEKKEAEAMKSGRFFDGNVSGVSYECASGITGTVTLQGEFSCPEKDATVTFKIGDIVLGSAAVGNVDLQTLANNNETVMINVAQLLLSADSDHNASNGIDVNASLVASLKDDDLLSALFDTVLEAALGGVPVSKEDAIAYMVEHFGYTPASSSSSSSLSSVSSSQSSSSSAQSSSSSSSSLSSSSSSSQQFVQPSSSSSSISSTVSSTAVISSSSSSSVSSSLSSSSSSSSSLSSSSSSSDQARKAVSVELEAEQWYVRLVAEAPARNMKTQSAQLGQLDAANAVENQSLKAMQPFSRGYLDIVFVNPDGLADGEYKSNFHVHRDGEADSWHFTVKTDDNRSDVIVTWRGLYVLDSYVDDQGRTRYHEYRSVTNPLLKKMQVVDESSGQILPVSSNGQTPAFIINMGGENTRTFRWELLTQNSNATAPSAAPVRVQKNARAFIRSASQPKPVEFDLSRPPEF